MNRFCRFVGPVFDCDFALKRSSESRRFSIDFLLPASLSPTPDKSLLFVFRFDYFCKKFAE
jgi:hypothetical protein